MQQTMVGYRLYHLQDEDAEYLGIHLGPLRFASAGRLATLTHLRGLISGPDGQTDWPIQRISQIGDQVYACGPWIPGCQWFGELALERGAPGNLEVLRQVIEVLLAYLGPAKDQGRPFSWFTALIAGPSCLVLPEELSTIVANNLALDERHRFVEAYDITLPKAPARSSYGWASLIYHCISGQFAVDPTTADAQWRRLEGVVLPLAARDLPIPPNLRVLVDRTLTLKDPLPKLEDWYSALSDDRPPLRLAENDPLRAAAFRKYRRGQSRLRRRSILRRGRPWFIVGAVILATIVSTALSGITEAQRPKRNLGLSPHVLTEKFYAAVRDRDFEFVKDATGGRPLSITILAEAQSLDLVTHIREATETKLNPTDRFVIAPATWAAEGFPDLGKTRTVFGFDQLKISERRLDDRHAELVVTYAWYDSFAARSRPRDFPVTVLYREDVLHCELVAKDAWQITSYQSTLRAPSNPAGTEPLPSR